MVPGFRSGEGVCSEIGCFFLVSSQIEFQELSAGVSHARNNAKKSMFSRNIENMLVVRACQD